MKQCPTITRHDFLKATLAGATAASLPLTAAKIPAAYEFDGKRELWNKMRKRILNQHKKK